ncbi:unknown [Firmicutes bacterium CAG:137]|nr:unknown [Firmicutes bacterium CAG:137]
MRAMAAEVVIVVGDAQICIHIVVAEGQLFIEVQILCRQLGGTLMNIQLGKHRRQFLHIQEIQRCQIRLLGQAGFLCILLQGVQECTVVKGLVVRVRTGVDDGNPAACAGVALLPGQACPSHTGGDVGLG